MGDVGVPELLIIILLIMVFFGSKKIPELAQNLAKGIREFRKATREIQEDEEGEVKKVEGKSQNVEKKG